MEIREYQIDPGSFSRFLKLAREVKDLRYELLPCLATLRCDLSGSMDLNSYVHMYGYDHHDHRDEVRKRSGADARWQAYLEDAKPMFVGQRSSIFKPAAALMDAVGADPDVNAASDRRKRLPMVELRRYKLKAGYDTVPRALAAFEAALPAKIEAARSAGVDHELELIAFTDVGRLNELVEVWRYGKASQCVSAREASRGVAGWRECIEKVAELTVSFDSSFMYEC